MIGDNDFLKKLAENIERIDSGFFDEPEDDVFVEYDEDIHSFIEVDNSEEE